MSPQFSRIDLVMRAEAAATSPGPSDSAAERAMGAIPASASMRSLSDDTSACFEPTLSYTVCADTPAALAMSRTLVRA